jgi:transcriptional regulator with PAS, ATPase and Fis domain
MLDVVRRMKNDDEPGSTASFPLSSAETPEASAWRIEVVEGPDAGTSLVRDLGTLSVGNRTDADLALTDESVSRRHAELHLLFNGVMVVDLGSRNGTRIGSNRIQSGVLRSGETVRFGKTHVTVTAERAGLQAELQSFGEFVTRSRELARMLAQLGRAARTSATILIEGETGTGKELLARAIHEASARASGPFVVIDCSTVVEGLLESQLFGHHAGAFTGAIGDQLGAFEAARGGTVFLDELGELPAQLQPKLLRVLESRSVKALGGVEERAIDVRIVAATNRDLETLAREGKFRSDLYYRVAVVRMRIPPLRERGEDIALLAKHLLERLSGGEAKLTAEAIDALVAHDWPGNARELRNVLESALATGESSTLGPADLFGARAQESAAASFHDAKERVVTDFERRYVTTLLERHGGNITRAAKEAGMSRNALQALLKRLKPEGP